MFTCTTVKSLNDFKQRLVQQTCYSKIFQDQWVSFPEISDFERYYFNKIRRYSFKILLYPLKSSGSDPTRGIIAVYHSRADGKQSLLMSELIHSQCVVVGVLKGSTYYL